MISYIRSVIMANPALYSEIGDRIYPIKFPSSDIILPAVILHVTDGDKHITGSWSSSLRVTVWTMTSTTEYGLDIAERLTSRLINLLQGHSGGDITCNVDDIDNPTSVSGVDEVDFDLFKIHTTFDVLWSEK